MASIGDFAKKNMINIGEEFKRMIENDIRYI
jgi:hypothetical protein